MAIISSQDDDGMMADINVTPLVDVMLVLLTVFIVTAPLLVNAVSVKLPQANASAASS
ncbi:MAG: biopolymer transporter ExbD, partial [Burkholderiales bacterium]|nr:biopolymer transporter ExbD [Burkholderiales bacterium]